MKLLTKKSMSNVLFVVLIGLILYPPTREWFIKQIAFSPSIEEVGESEKINSYDWQLIGLNSESLNFNQLKGQVVFVNFWATWCPSCRAEFSMAQELYNDYKDKVKFVFVTNENWETVNSFYSKNGYDIPVFNSKSMPPELFLETNTIPAGYLIDQKGNVLIKKTGPANWNSEKVRKLLDKLMQ